MTTSKEYFNKNGFKGFENNPRVLGYLSLFYFFMKTEGILSSACKNTIMDCEDYVVNVKNLKFNGYHSTELWELLESQQTLENRKKVFTAFFKV